MTYTVLKKAWWYCLEKAGVVDYRIHDLRHEVVTTLYDIGNRELDIAAVARWKTPNVQGIPMLSRYKHTNKLEAVQRIVFKDDGLNFA
jgi:integrase